MKRKLIEIRRFIIAFITFLYFYRDGFVISSNIHKNKPNEPEGYWGFYRIHNVNMAGLLDIDYQTNDKGTNYFHSRGGDCKMYWTNPGSKDLRGYRN